MIDNYGILNPRYFIVYSMKKFYSTKSLLYKILIFVLPIILSIATIVMLISVLPSSKPTMTEKIGLLIFSIIAMGAFYLMYSSWNNTYYTIEDDGIFHYRSGMLSGSLEIKHISHLKKSTMMTSGIRPALGSPGYIIYHSAGRTVFVSPENPEEFVSELQKMNKNIFCIGA